jgi:DNA helicase HerA-like ATPase
LPPALSTFNFHLKNFPDYVDKRENLAKNFDDCDFREEQHCGVLASSGGGTSQTLALIFRRITENDSTKLTEAASPVTNNKLS